jgi:DNA polymerase III epsilon subunit-like protein
VVAHNAAFDIGALRAGCDAADVEWPTLTYGCSLMMARRSGLGLLSYRLPLVCAGWVSGRDAITTPATTPRPRPRSSWR